MKKLIAALAALAFVLVLLIKPFNFMEVYSTHVGHTIHSLTADRHDGHEAPVTTDVAQVQDQHVLIELSKASFEASGFKTKFWSVSLLVLASAVVLLSLNKRKRRKKKAKKAASR